MESTIEENSIKPVNKLRERFEALAISSSNKPGSSPNNDHDEQVPITGQEATTSANASPRASGLHALRSVSTSTSPTPSTSIILKKGSESDISNDADEFLTPTLVRASSPLSVGRKIGLKPPPPPPPERTALRSKSSADSVGSLKKMTPVGVHRKPPPPPPAHGQPGHAASLSVGDLVNQINALDSATFRSLDTSPINSPGILAPLDGRMRSPSPIPSESMESLVPPSSANSQAPPLLPIRINIPESFDSEPPHSSSQAETALRSPVKRIPPLRTHLVFTPSTPLTPAPPLPSRTSPDNQNVKNNAVHHSLPRRTDTTNFQSEADEFGIGLRSPPPRHHSLTSRSPSASVGRPAPPPPPRPSSVASSAATNSPQSTVTTHTLINAPPPLPNRRSNPNLRGDETPVSTSPVSSLSAPAMATRPSASSWGRLAAASKLSLLKSNSSENGDQPAFRPPPPPTRTIAPGDKLPPLRRVSGDDSSDSDDDISPGQTSTTPTSRRLQDDMPDSSQSRRCPPALHSFPSIPVSSHGVVVAVAGYWACVAHTTIDVYDMQKMPSRQFALDLEHMGLDWRSKEPRITSMEFRPGETREDDGRYLWCGAKDGHLFELDIWTGNITNVLIPSGGHSLTVTHILRYGNSMITMDESGKIIVFEPPENEFAATLSRFTRSHRVAEKQSFVKILGGYLWTSSGSGGASGTNSLRGAPFRAYDLSATNFSTKHLFPSEAVGPALCGAIIPKQPSRVYIGHEGGSLSVWRYDDASSQHVCIQTIKLYSSSIVCMEGVGSRLWLGTRSGTITVCEVREDSPWLITNQWQAHDDSPVAHIAVDPYSITKVGQLVVYTVGRDDRMAFWDGLIEYNWIDAEMQRRERQYSTYREVKVLICTWNIDSAKPDTLAASVGNRENAKFLDNVLGSVDSPDIIIFGFQEVIDLENKKLTAKTVLLGGQKSKIEGKISEKVSRSYRMWYDRLVLAVRLAMPPEDPYTVIHSENLVGLFTCIFVRSSERMSLKDSAITTIKRGMKGHYAAGQKHIRERNQDLAAIFDEKSVFPPVSHDASATAYVGGGDGSMILDHEVVFLNGDLNYRIDQRRELVVQSIQLGDLNTLLLHDQLIKEMQNNPGFRLRSFTEAAITFYPTYKYDRGSNEFDSSEKHRIPAWCDRILFRSRGDRVHCDHYRRYEPNVSDHRPVSGGFRVEVKSVDRDAWISVRTQVQEEWQERQCQLLRAMQEFYISGKSRLLL
ncbi:hypothetical protein CTheo_1242 [Ceratobasidium theobromae]|uniref:Inositol polyphosphate-related phosphatase domain-containing protein n=1 Tax=Ceratobasidium theobromae TaxID=1582974 RepID=A0A5N5QUE7_9AGAM|nr:hypothetical protein CTheo_1242 [Ceratobasidium theobromae]